MQVKQYIHQSYLFTCITQSDKPGYWSKIDLFQPGRFKGRVLYLDLDVTVKGNLDDLADYPAPFVIVKDAFRFGFNSSVMAWDAGVADHVYTDWIKSGKPEVKGGDQSWITQVMPSAHLFPRPWIQSFKHACLKGGFQPDLRVCIFHGWPKPWELAEYV